MAQKFGQVRPGVWTDEKFRDWSDDAKMLALYLLTNAWMNTCGMYRLPLLGALSDLRWSEGRFRAAMAQLEASRYAMYDDPAEVVLVLRTVKHQPLGGARNIAGAVNHVDATPRCPRLFAVHLAMAEKYAPAYAEALRERWPTATADAVSGIEDNRTEDERSTAHDLGTQW